MLLIFLCALGISFSFMATRKRCSGFPTHPSRSPSLSAHPCRVGGFASRFIRRCVDTQREGGGIYLRFSSYFLLPILQMSVEGSQEASILTHLLPFRSETVSSTLDCLIQQQFHIPIDIIQSQSRKTIRTATSALGPQNKIRPLSGS